MDRLIKEEERLIRLRRLKEIERHDTVAKPRDLFNVKEATTM